MPRTIRIARPNAEKFGRSRLIDSTGVKKTPDFRDDSTRKKMQLRGSRAVFPYSERVAGGAASPRVRLRTALAAAVASAFPQGAGRNRQQGFLPALIPERVRVLPFPARYGKRRGGSGIFSVSQRPRNHEIQGPAAALVPLVGCRVVTRRRQQTHQTVQPVPLECERNSQRGEDRSGDFSKCDESVHGRPPADGRPSLGEGRAKAFISEPLFANSQNAMGGPFLYLQSAKDLEIARGAALVGAGTRRVK
jgi:hypothetical protein